MISESLLAQYILLFLKTYKNNCLAKFFIYLLNEIKKKKSLSGVNYVWDFVEAQSDIFSSSMHLSANVIVSSNMNKATKQAREKRTQQKRRDSPLLLQTEFLRLMCTCTATPAVFKTPIVNVTHSEWRHIAAFLMRGICGRVLRAKLTMRRAKTRERKIARIVSGGEKGRKKKEEETKARIALIMTKQMRGSSLSHVIMTRIYASVTRARV